MWEEVDLEQKRLSIIMGKTRRKLEVPLNDAALAVLEAKQAAKHGPYVFYNPLTGAGSSTSRPVGRRRFGGLALAASPGTPSGHVRFAPHEFRRGPRDREGTARALDDQHHHAVRAQQPRHQGSRRGEAPDQ